MKTKSQKGKWGHVGAPPKTVKYPRSRFTVERAVALNSGVCELTIRKRIKADVKAGTLVTLPVIKQPKKAVGRPKFCFQLKALVGKAKPVKLTKTPRVTKPKTATVVTVATNTPTAPTPPPVTNATTPVATAPEVPATTVVPAPLP
jgi:hypothetical protein